MDSFLDGSTQGHGLSWYRGELMLYRSRLVAIVEGYLSTRSLRTFSGQSKRVGDSSCSKRSHKSDQPFFHSIINFQLSSLLQLIHTDVFFLSLWCYCLSQFLPGNHQVYINTTPSVNRHPCAMIACMLEEPSFELNENPCPTY